MFIHWESSFTESTIHAFFTLTEMGLDMEKISKSTSLKIKVSLFDKTSEQDICHVFHCKLSFCDMSDATKVKSELVSCNTLVLMDFDLFETMTGVTCKYVLGEMVSEWNV